MLFSPSSWWLVLAALQFGFMSTAVKLVSDNHNALEIMFYRQSLALIFVCYFVIFGALSLRTKFSYWHFLRALAGTGALALFYYLLGLYPISTVLVLSRTSPIFYTILVAVLLKESLNRGQLIGITVAFLGVVLLLKPAIVQDEISYVLLGLLSGFLAGAAYMCVRKLVVSNEPILRCLFYFSLTSVLFSLLLAKPISTGFTMPNLDDTSLLVAIGLLGLGAQLTLMKGMSYKQRKVNMSMMYITVIMVGLIDYFYFSQRLGLFEVLGMIAIMQGIIIVERSDKSKLTI